MNDDAFLFLAGFFYKVVFSVTLPLLTIIIMHSMHNRQPKTPDKPQVLPLPLHILYQKKDRVIEL